MKILFIHNKYAKMSGEEQSVINLTQLLERHGHTIELLTRSSAEISDSLSGKIKSFFIRTADYPLQIYAFSVEQESLKTNHAVNDFRQHARPLEKH